MIKGCLFRQPFWFIRTIPFYQLKWEGFSGRFSGSANFGENIPN